MKINKRIKVYGRVQGVFFRKSTQDKALELGISGWVKNEPDGTVLAEIEGIQLAIQEMQAWLRKGPPMANVTQIDIEDGVVQDHQNFLILR